jgi:hypothetical protein
MCPSGQGWDISGHQCRACKDNFAIPCNGAGETGSVLVTTPMDGATCVCETKDGYYLASEGSDARPCDLDQDGWVSDSAQPAIEGQNAVLRANAHCHVRRIARVWFDNDAKKSSFEVGGDNFNLTLKFPGDPTRAIDPGLPLYESARNDGESSTSPPAPYTVNGLGRALDPKELNSLTRACVNDLDDYNDNSIPDVAEDVGRWATRTGGRIPSSGPLNDYYSVYAQFSYFLELHNGWYEAATPARSYAVYHIQERPRTGVGTPLVPVQYPTGTPATAFQCARHIDSLYQWDPSTGMLKSPSTIGGDFVVFKDAAGMTHHSQYKCVDIVTDAAYQGHNEEEDPQLVYVTTADAGTDAAADGGAAASMVLARQTKGTMPAVRLYPWTVNDCYADTPSNSVPPSNGPNPTFPNILCNPVSASEGVHWAAVDFENVGQTVPYTSCTQPLQDGGYQRGCINECVDNQVPDVPGDCLKCGIDAYGHASQSVPDPSDPQHAGNPCTDDVCSGTVTTHPPLPPGTPCGSGLACDSNGACTNALCAPCTADAQCPVGQCRYTDCDGDGYGDQNAANRRCGDGTTMCNIGNKQCQLATNNTDCCDSDPKAYPGETIYYTVQDACGSWDYDCSGAIDYRWPVISVNSAYFSNGVQNVRRGL